jgi:hypothetical protein
MIFKQLRALPLDKDDAFSNILETYVEKYRPNHSNPA